MTTNIHFYCILFCNNCQYTTAAFCEICETLVPSRQPWYNKSSIRVPDGTQAERNGIDYEQSSRISGDGHEECEALIPADLLRRAGVEVVLASITGSLQVTGSHGIHVTADALAEEVTYADTDLLFLPGGLPGTTHLGESMLVKEKVLEFAAKGKKVAAICAAPACWWTGTAGRPQRDFASGFETSWAGQMSPAMLMTSTATLRPDGALEPRFRLACRWLRSWPDRRLPTRLPARLPITADQPTIC